jgi:hypothetical protein
MKNKSTAEPQANASAGLFVTATPAKGCRVRKPDGSLLADEGEAVNTNADASYWLRRELDGDVVLSPTTGDEA